MPRRAVELCADEYYHLYNRGNNREPIFYERDNYAFFLQRIWRYLTPAAQTVAYCLMPTHYHLLVRLKEPSLSHHMQLLSISYTKAINARYERVGVLFQGAFRARLIDRDDDLIHLSAYIHLNPYKAGLVKRPEGWEFSSYREFIGLRSGSLPAPDVVLSQFPSRAAYQEYVEALALRDEDALDGLDPE